MIRLRGIVAGLALLISIILLSNCGSSGSGNPGTEPPPTSDACASITISDSLSASLSWTAPSLNTDGSTIEDLAGYRIFYRDESSSFTDALSIDAGNVTQYVVKKSDLPGSVQSGKYYFAIATYDLAMTESVRSDSVCANVTVQ